MVGMNKRHRSIVVFWIALLTLISALVLPTPASASAVGPPQYPGSPLKIGDSGADVITWQEALGVISDGDFGPATRAATVIWQEENGMVGHGWVGEIAWARMFGVIDTPAEVVVEGSGWGHGVGMPQYGARGMAEEGFAYSDILSYFYTGSSVMQVGEALGSGHWLMSAENPIWVNVFHNTNGVTVASSGGTLTFCQEAPDDIGTLDNGDTGPMVEVLQHELIELGYLESEADGNFGLTTESAVIAFQTAFELEVDGRVGPATREALWPADESGEQCVIEIPFASGTPVFSRIGAYCSFSLAPPGMASPVEASCNASIRGDGLAELTPNNHVKLLSGRGYSGGYLRLRMGSGSAGNLHAVHQVSIETYVAGIREVPEGWDPDALKAQAVAARSYGVYPLRLSSFVEPKPTCQCHHYSSTKSQVYVGYTSPDDPDYRSDWVQAVADTTGEIMHHPDAGTTGIVQTFFSSSAGGRTQNSGDVWSPRDYLVSVPDLWSTNPAYGNVYWSWSYTFSPEVVASKLGIETLVSIAVSERYVSGASKTVTVTYTEAASGLLITTFGGKQVTSLLDLKGRYYDIDWPPTQVITGFIDTFGSVHKSDIDMIAELGITRGCNPPTNTMFCPSDSVTRGQMAAFLVRAFDLPTTTIDHFADDDGTTFESDINKLTSAGITAGCGGGNYCPDQTLPRAQMAAFLVRVLDLPEFVGEDKFVDDDGSSFEGNIESLAAAGITLGCNPPTNDQFCPDTSVTREQMTSFLVRSLVYLASS